MFPHPVTVSKDTATVHTTCLFCQLDQDIDLDIDKYISWQTGTLIQDAFPDLDAGKREVLITSICSDCFEACTLNE